ncbi:SAM-dependent methyltransferase, partial [Klebsiella pneumoniae]
PLQQALVPGGTLVFSAEHPIYTAPLQQGWRVDEQGQKSWPVSHYQQEGERVSNWFAEGVIKQHRKLSSWINALIAAGFVLEQLDEWGPSAEQIVQQPALDEEKERPMIFLLRARKPG